MFIFLLRSIHIGLTADGLNREAVKKLMKAVTILSNYEATMPV